MEVAPPPNMSNCERAPLIVTNYCSMLVRAVLSVIFVCLIFGSTWLFVNDLGERIHDRRRLIALYSSDCKRQWESNRCQPETRVPGVQELCLRYEECMNKSQAGLISIMAESFGEMIESFLLSISFIAVFKLAVTTIIGVYLWRIK
jgi:hypothetical protein